MDWSKIRLVSLDVDGTLYSLRRMRWTFARLFLRRMLREGPFKVIADLRRIREFHRRADRLRANGNSFDPNRHPELAVLERGTVAGWYGPAIAMSGPVDGLLEFLDWLKARRITIVACTDYRCDFKLAALGVVPYFSRLYEGTVRGAFKPAAEIAKGIRADYRLAADQMLHIGDHPVKDGAWGEAGICRTIILKDSFRPLLDEAFFEN